MRCSVVRTWPTNWFSFRSTRYNTRMDECIYCISKHTNCCCYTNTSSHIHFHTNTSCISRKYIFFLPATDMPTAIANTAAVFGEHYSRQDRWGDTTENTPEN